MDKEDILSRVDHTLLKQTTTWEQIEKLCREGMEYGTASVCIPLCCVKQTKDLVGDKLAICAVIGFPNGNIATVVKVLETEDAVRDGADETDMAISIDLVKAGRYNQVLDEIRQIEVACGGRCLKVIIETRLLTEEEKREVRHVVTESGADFTRTFTRFFMTGATPEDMALMKKYSGPKVKVRTTGGIASIEDTERFTELGADRLGVSRPIP